MLIIITGNGKGKTTSAVGQTIRAVGQGSKVYFTQFIKSDSYPSGEDKVLRSMSPKVRFEKGGRGFVGIMGDKLPRAVHVAAAKKCLQRARAAARSGKYGLVVLDEVNVALALKLLTLKSVAAFLADVPPGTDIILTGRGAHPSLIRKADLVTECNEVKHPYQKKVAARKGLEY